MKGRQQIGWGLRSSHLDNVSDYASGVSDLPYRILTRRHYEVEICFKNSGDVAFHFFPRRGQITFAPFGYELFGHELEQAFVRVLGRGIRMRADFLPADKMIARADNPSVPCGQPTFWVLVEEVGKRSRVQHIMQTDLLEEADRLLDRCMPELLSGQHPQIVLRSALSQRV